MFYFLFLLICLLFLSLFLIINANSKCTIAFKIRIETLEKTILDLNKKLANQNQKIQLSDDLKTSMRASNNKLGQQIVDMNLEMFEELFPKKSS